MTQSGLSKSSELQRVIDAARTPEWSLGVDASGRIMATRDSGRIGLPWVVVAARAGRGLRVSKYEPGDDLNADGVVVTDVGGGPREMGRQLRDVLRDLEDETRSL